MGGEWPSDENVFKYLLGDSLDEEMENEIEHRYGHDSAFYEQVLALEDDLVVSYLKGELKDRSKEMFEEHFLITPWRRRRLRWLRALLSIASKETPVSAPSSRTRGALRAFVCSTYDDLVAERQAVFESIRKTRHQHDSMEFFGARPQRAIETCLQEVRKSDILIMILGYRYGTLAPGLRISFMEAEYQEAYRLNKPCLVYMPHPDVPVLPRFIERNPKKLRLLEQLRATIRERHTPAYFKDANDLALRVAADIGGTIRALETSLQLAIPPAIPVSAPVEPPPQPKEALEVALAEEFGGSNLSESELLGIRQIVASRLLALGRRRPVVYLCHSRAEARLASLIRDRLSGRHIAWWGEQAGKRNQPSGFKHAARGFDTADLVVLLISRQLLRDAGAQRQLDLIIARRISTGRTGIVLPVVVDGATVPSVLRDGRSLDISSDEEAIASERVAEAILKRLAETMVLLGLRDKGRTSTP